MQSLVLAQQSRSCACSTPSPRFWGKARIHTQRDDGSGDPKQSPAQLLQAHPRRHQPITGPSLHVPGEPHPHCPDIGPSRRNNRSTSPEFVSGSAQGYRTHYRMQGKSIWDCTGLTVGFCEGWRKHKRMDKGIKRADHISAGNFSGHLSGPVLHLSSRVCPVFPKKGPGTATC